MRGDVLETKSIVSKFAEVVAENLLVQISEQVEWFHADIGALQLALEQTPEVFESVGVNLPVNVGLRVVYDLVLESLMLESLIGHERIGVDRASCLDVSADVGLEQVLFAIAYDGGANLAATLKDSLNGNLVLGASLGNPALALVGVHETGRTTDESFVYFDFLATAAELDGGTGLHRKTNPMEHEPCGFLGDAKSAANLVRANAILAIRNHPHSDKPLVERQSGVLKDSSNLDGELFLGMLALALPHATSGDEANIIPATSGAFDAIRPAALNNEVEAIIRVGKVLDGLLESFGLGVHGVPHKKNRSRNALLSQVYYCPYNEHRGWGCLTLSSHAVSR